MIIFIIIIIVFCVLGALDLLVYIRLPLSEQKTHRYIDFPGGALVKWLVLKKRR